MSTVPVQWGDMDAFQHVNNAVYFRWFESARIEYTGRLGLGVLMRTAGIGPILASQACDYLRPVVFPDTVHVGSKVTRVGRTSFAMEHAILVESAKVIAARSTSTVVVFDYKLGCPTPIPDEVRRAIAALEGREI